MAGALMREHSELHMQTHLSENHAEIALTQELYPWSRDYTDVYEHYGILGKKALLGHCIHLSEREADAFRISRSVAVFCPTSNLFLGSGLFDYQRYRRREKALRIASGDGCRRRHQLFDAADDGRGLQGDRSQRRKAQSFRSPFWQMTRGNAEALSITGKVGTLDVGTDADIVVLDSGATPGMRLQDGNRANARRRTFPVADARRRPRGERGLCRRKTGEKRDGGERRGMR